MSKGVDTSDLRFRGVKKVVLELETRAHTELFRIHYDIQLPINHVISKTVLHLVAVYITKHKHSKHTLKVWRKFSKSFNIKLLFWLFFLIKVETNDKNFHCKAFKW